MTLFLQFANKFFKNVDKAKAFAPELWKSVRDRLRNGSLKASNTERLRRIKNFTDSLKKKPKNVKAILPTGIEQTVHTARAVKLNILTSSNNKYLTGSSMTIEDLLQDELMARGLAKSVEETSNLKAKRDAIQLHEFGRIKMKDPMKEVPISQVKEFQPMSERMKAFLSLHQSTILDETRRGS
jgi:hypothetical protein